MVIIALTCVRGKTPVMRFGLYSDLFAARKLVSWGDMKYKQESEGGALVDVGGAQVDVGECGGKRYTGPQRTFKKACWSSNLVYTGGRDSILLILEYVIMKSC